MFSLKTNKIPSVLLYVLGVSFLKQGFMTTLSNAKETKAVKEHRCNFCGYKIPKGDTYMKSTHVYDSRLYDWKTHDHCHEIANKLKMYDECDEGVSQDDFYEIIDNEHSALMASLIPEKNIQNYNEIMDRLGMINFKDKLGYVIRFHKDSLS